MAQFGLKLPLTWFSSLWQKTSINVDEIPQWFDEGHATRHYALADWQVYVWGDSAMMGHDCAILTGLIEHQPQSVFGRSWIAINQSQQCLLAATDQLGLFPILAYQTEGYYYLSSDRHLLHRMLGKLPALSTHAMRQLLCYGQILDQTSIIEHATHFSGCRLIKLKKGLLEAQELSKVRLFATERQSTPKQAIEAFVESVRACLHHADTPLLSLSGGLDSRLILAACQALGQKVPALCYGESQSQDVLIAKLLAKQSGIPLFVGREVQTDRAWQTSRRVSMVGLGEVPLHHAHALLDEDLINQTQSRTIITGTGAEAFRAFYYDRGMPGFELFDQPWLQRFSRPRIYRYITEEFHRLAGPLFRVFPEFELQLQPLFQQKLAQEFDQSLDSARAADQFYLDVRVSRMVVAGQQLLDPYYHRTHPFLAPDVLKTLGSLPARWKVGSAFHRYAIGQLAPQLAEIPWDKTGLPLSHGLPLKNRYPGLINKLGGQGLYGKQAKPMFDYQKFGHRPYEHVLDRVLAYLGCGDDKQRQQQIWQLFQSNAFLHVKGLADVWSHLIPSKEAV